MNVLFICSQNMLRSPTAEATFRGTPGLDVASAGTAEDAEKPVTATMIEWADKIIVMETHHQKRLVEKFGPLLKTKEPIVLRIRDDYEYMDPKLVELLKERATPYLRFG